MFYIHNMIPRDSKGTFIESYLPRPSFALCLVRKSLDTFFAITKVMSYDKKCSKEL